MRQARHARSSVSCRGGATPPQACVNGTWGGAARQWPDVTAAGRLAPRSSPSRWPRLRYELDRYKSSSLFFHGRPDVGALSELACLSPMTCESPRLSRYRKQCDRAPRVRRYRPCRDSRSLRGQQPAERLSSHCRTIRMVEEGRTPTLRRSSPHFAAARGQKGRDCSTVKCNLALTSFMTFTLASVPSQLASPSSTVDPCNTTQPRATRRPLHTRSIISQNCRGLKTGSRVTEFISELRERHIWAAGCQETWRSGRDDFTEDGCCFLGVGPEQQQGRGSAGVALVLSRSATAAWQAAGAVLHADLGPRVIAAPLLARDARTRRPLGVYLMSTYAPTSDASEADLDAYYSAFSSALARKPHGYVLLG